MFYAAESVLLTKDLAYSSHKGIIFAFGKHFIKNNIFPRTKGRELNKAFGKRQLGDYEYTFVISEEEALELLKIGNNFVDNIIQYLNEKDLL